MGAWVAGHRVALALLVAVTLAGGLLRADVAAAPNRHQSVDERAYARLARSLVRTGHYGDDTMTDPVRWAPGAPFVFALAQEIGPPMRADRGWDVPSAYPLQAAVGTALIPAVFVLGLLLGGVAAGLLAATAIAFYPPLISASGDLLTEPLGALLLCGALIAVALALRRPSVGRAIAAGALLGLTVLVRADLVLLPFVLAVVVALRSLRAGAVLAVAAVIVLTPWSVYASRQTGRFTPVSSGGASNLFVGTYLPGDGRMFGVKRALGFSPKTSQKDVLASVARRHPELDREQALRKEALHNLRVYALGHPLDFARMALRKVDRLWLGYSVSTHRNDNGAIRAYHLLLVAIGGLGLAWGLARRPRSAGLWVVALTVLYVTAVNAVLVSEARHNLPILPVLVAGGAGALVAVARRLGVAAASRPLRTAKDARRRRAAHLP